MSDRRKDSTRTRRNKKRTVSVALPPTSSEFSEYRRSENQRQQQLANAQTQIDNVAQAVVRWLLDNPAAKEQPYFFALQERLAELNEILVRLVKRQSLPTDGHQWSATRTEALSLLEKSGQSAGFIAVLPEELAGIGIPASMASVPAVKPAEKPRKVRKSLQRTPVLPIPTVAELRRLVSISQRQAADLLRCDPRTIWNYLAQKKLTRAGKARVRCDDNLVRLLREKHGDLRLQ